jgi:phosphatidylinositol-bisphosphatase
LNSRSKKDYKDSIKAIKSQKNPKYDDIVKQDELYKHVSEGKSFKNFIEPRIGFSPTYKYDLKTNNYDTSEKSRLPSYCVRLEAAKFLKIV